MRENKTHGDQLNKSVFKLELPPPPGEGERQLLCNPEQPGPVTDYPIDPHAIWRKEHAEREKRDFKIY